MYVFAVILFMGLVIKALVDFLGFLDLPKSMRLLSAMVLGIVAAYLFNLNMFAAFGVEVRAGMGVLGTGLVFGSVAGVWHDLLGWIKGHARKTMDEAIQLETAHPKAA